MAMDFKDNLKMLADRIAKVKDTIKTEEATKTALILPFIQLLGYDIFNPMEVTPECDCDYGTKKGEKIDYTIFKDEQPIMIIECKHLSEDLTKHQAQLFRYYHVSKAKFAVLTNGITYKFFTDLETPNKMDDMPFFEINMLDLKDTHIEKLKEFHSNNFNVDSILNTASELKYTNAIKNIITTESKEPSEEFIKYFAKQVYSGRLTKDVLDQFGAIVKRAFSQYANDYVNTRLKQAIAPEEIHIEQSEPIDQSKPDDKIITTEEELQGFYIVRAILAGKTDIKRVCYRDAQTYFAILFDDNNRKPICRLYFNGGKKYVETFDKDKKGTKHLISSLEDIYSLTSIITETVESYLA